MMMDACFDWNVLSSILSTIISLVNLVFVVVFAFVEHSRIKKIEKHHDISNWYISFKLHEDIYELISSADTFSQLLCSAISNSQLDPNKIVECENIFKNELYLFKDKYLTIVEVIDRDSVNELLDNLNEIEDEIVAIVTTLINLVNDDDKRRTIISVVSNIKKKVVAVGYRLSAYK